ncbi:hypothetical protein RND81_06G198100 [Saponaria officinalis]|uniref:Uncharacterized protein n=1 Tax=Saponaria officinalis TaxID=3572 RepID=A0AAW1KBV3_SAPOF
MTISGIFAVINCQDIGLRLPLEVTLSEPEVDFSFAELGEPATLSDEIDLGNFSDLIQRSMRPDNPSNPFSIIIPRVNRNVHIQLGDEALLMKDDCFWKVNWPFMKVLEESATIVDGFVKVGLLEEGGGFFHFHGKWIAMAFYIKADDVIIRYMDG